MSDLEHVYFRSPHSPADFAAEIAGVVGMRVIRGEHGETYLSRPLPEGGAMGGELHTNDLVDPAEPSFLDVFPLVLDLGVTVPGRGRRLAEARAFFAELAGVCPVPVALTRGFDFLVGVGARETGLLWFPEGVTPYAEHRRAWSPVQPAPLAGSGG